MLGCKKLKLPAVLTQLLEFPDRGGPGGVCPRAPPVTVCPRGGPAFAVPKHQTRVRHLTIVASC